MEGRIDELELSDITKETMGKYKNTMQVIRNTIKAQNVCVLVIE